MISFLDLGKINKRYSDELKQAVSEVIDSGWYLHGNKVKEFEDSLSSFIGVRNAIGVANGLDALRLIIRAYMEIGILKEGDEIIVPANTYIATILAITDNRLIPKLIDPDLYTYNLDFSLIEQNITLRTKAVIVVHLYGRTCWDAKLEAIAKRFGLIIIEDNAQAIGATHISEKKHIRTGALGNAAGFSFYPGKNLGSLGDAGAVTTNDDELGKVIRAIANYGSEVKYINYYQGLNSRMDEIQAAFLSIKLKYLTAENQRRREVAYAYCTNITNPEITLPIQNDDYMKILQEFSHVWHLFIIRCKRRNALQEYLAQKGIQTLIHYPVPPHKQRAYSYMNKLSLPVTEKIHSEVLSLPMSPVLSDEEVEYVTDAINSFN